jgi:iron complex outermembrane receptor protein
VAYLLAPSATVYAGVQSAVEPCELQAIALLQTGRRYAPTRTRQTQAGTKVDLFGGKLGLRLEAYRIEQHDAMNFDPWDADFVLQRIPGTSSRGLDIEANGRLLPQLDLSLGFQFVRTRQVWLGVDDEFYAVPGTGGSSRSMQLLARYRLPPGQGSESSIGVAFRAYSHQWVSPPNPDGFNPSLRVPGGALLGLSWTRAAGPWSTTLALNNVFDRNLYGLATEDSFVVAQPRRSFALTLTYRP